MDRNTIIAAIKSLCSMPSNDNVEFRYVKDSEIRKEDIYGGFSITLEGRIENIHQQSISISLLEIRYTLMKSIININAFLLRKC